MRRWNRTYLTARGLTVRSGFEKRVIEDLDARGVAYTYETYSYNWYEKLRAVCHECESPETYAERWYTPDVFLGNGVIVEIKGKFTPKDRKILIGMQDVHPELDIRLLFMQDNKLSKSSETRYTEWASANDIAAVVGTAIPEGWIAQ